MGHRHDAHPVRITTAPQSRERDISSRQRRYLFSMAVRTLCVVGAVLVGAGWLRWVLIAGAVFLPYIAVVMANAASSRPEEAELRQQQQVRRSLGPTDRGSRDDTSGSTDHGSGDDT